MDSGDQNRSAEVSLRLGKGAEGSLFMKVHEERKETEPLGLLFLWVVL